MPKEKRVSDEVVEALARHVYPAYSVSEPKEQAIFRTEARAAIEKAVLPHLQATPPDVRVGEEPCVSPNTTREERR